MPDMVILSPDAMLSALKLTMAPGVTWVASAVTPLKIPTEAASTSWLEPILA